MIFLFWKFTFSSNNWSKSGSTAYLLEILFLVEDLLITAKRIMMITRSTGMHSKESIWEHFGVSVCLQHIPDIWSHSSLLQLHLFPQLIPWYPFVQFNSQFVPSNPGKQKHEPFKIWQNAPFRHFPLQFLINSKIMYDH